MAAVCTSLTAEQLDFLDTQGYLQLPAIIPPEELTRLREIYDRIFRERLGWEDGAMFDLGGAEDGGELVLPQILGPSRYVPELQQTAFWANTRAIAEQVWPGEKLSMGEHMIYKPAGHGSATPWHQDQAYHDPNHLHRKLNFWMPLDDADETSGCLHFVPGSHRFAVLPHRRINGDARIHGLEVVDPTPWEKVGVAVPVPAGGCSIHAAYMLHYANPNKSTRPRRAYILTYGAPPTKLDQPIDMPWQQEVKTARLERARNAEKAKPA